jgi:hypothetical protein
MGGLTPSRLFGGPHQVLQYLVLHPPSGISNGRLLGLENGQVRFRWRDSRDQNAMIAGASSIFEAVQFYAAKILVLGLG